MSEKLPILLGNGFGFSLVILAFRIRIQPDGIESRDKPFALDLYLSSPIHEQLGEIASSVQVSAWKAAETFAS